MDLVTPTTESEAFDNAFPEQFTSLNDAFEKGDLEVWYMSPDFFRFGGMGIKPNVDCLGLTHIKLGSIACPTNLDCDEAIKEIETHLDNAWISLQGERWSPQGQANELIRSKGLQHTSMSKGDCFRVADLGNIYSGAIWMVASDGFDRLDKD